MDTQRTLNNTVKVLEIMVGAASVYVALRVVAGPDAMKTLTMRSAKLAESACERQARFWAHAADACTVVYEHARPVGV